MLIRGGEANNMRYGDTLSDDKFEDFKFKYLISNPPFGIDWKKEQKAVKAEHALGKEGRFEPGRPPIKISSPPFNPFVTASSTLNPVERCVVIKNSSVG